jgi:hypothetical protein
MHLALGALDRFQPGREGLRAVAQQADPVAAGLLRVGNPAECLAGQGLQRVQG